MQKSLGGDRLGSGNKMKIDLHNYERSTHDLSYTWRSTMAAGTLVPFLKQLALPGDTFDINLNTDVLTHPTIGPLLGSYKVQLDVFSCPIRLYNAQLHNNALGIGLKMQDVKLPVITMTVQSGDTFPMPQDNRIDNAQINPSCLLAYLGLKGIGVNGTNTAQSRQFNAVPILAYWDIYKQYYSNKAEEIGAVIHTPADTTIQTIGTITIQNLATDPPITLDEYPVETNIPVTNGAVIKVTYIGTRQPPELILINVNGILRTLPDVVLLGTLYEDTASSSYTGSLNVGTTIINNWKYDDGTTARNSIPKISTFPLSHIDDMRNAILQYTTPLTPFDINTPDITPYTWLAGQPNGNPNALSSQEGLGLKTYQSDLYNNWINTEWIDGTGGINELTAIDTSSGSFTIDTLNISNKVYKILTRIAVSGGTYDDWLDAVYTEDRYKRCESPMYMGGLIKELIFQEIVSQAASETTNGQQVLGTLAGKGAMAPKHKGGNLIIKVDEPSYIMGIVSLTPRIDYSQGNDWDLNLQTLDDFHKPGLDEIGFQELITQQLAWWDSKYNSTTLTWDTFSAGKQPAWLNYMTNVNKVYGNFAIPDNEMFMTLNRRYEYDESLIGSTIADLTTYIDPSKYNFVFAETSLDAQNFWVQIAVGITARRKMSAKLMPNL